MTLAHRLAGRSPTAEVSMVTYMCELSSTRCPHGTGMKDRTRSVSLEGAHTVLRGVTARQGRPIAPNVSESAQVGHRHGVTAAKPLLGRLPPFRGPETHFSTFYCGSWWLLWPTIGPQLAHNWLRDGPRKAQSNQNKSPAVFRSRGRALRPF